MMAAVVLCCLWSCNEKPRHYKFVKRAMDGTEQVETIEAQNDTAALSLYIDRMSQVIVDNMNDNGKPFEAMFIISPEGDTLNTNKDMLEIISERIQAIDMTSQRAAIATDTVVPSTPAN